MQRHSTPLPVDDARLGENNPLPTREVLFPVFLSLFFFLSFITDAFLLDLATSAMLAVCLSSSLLIYALYTLTYLLRGHRDFRFHYFMSASLSIIPSFFFWSIFEIWTIEYIQLMFGFLIASLPSLGVFYFMNANTGGTEDVRRGSIYAIPACIAIFVVLAVALAPPLTITFW